MKNLTTTQKELINKIENEFIKLNATNEVAENDLIAMIESAIDEKREKRKELEIMHNINIDEVTKVKNRIVSKLEPICQKYGFNIEVKELQGSGYLERFKIKIITNVQYTSTNGFKNYETIEAYLKINFNYLEGTNKQKHFCCSPIPTFETGYCSTYVSNESDFIDYYVRRVIEILKSKI